MYIGVANGFYEEVICCKGGTRKNSEEERHRQRLQKQ